jgi:hypothetical protein
LAVDSCLKAIEKEDKFVTGNILRANSALIASYKQLEKHLSSSQLEGLKDALKYLTHQIQTLAACKGRETELGKQLSALENGNQ